MRKIEKIEIEKSKRYIPCLWEKGGGYSNTGKAQLICDMNGFEKKPIYVRKSGSLACEEHALIPIRKNDVVVMASHHRGDFNIEVFQIKLIQDEEAHLELINSFSQGEWDNEQDYWHSSPVVEAAQEKALDYHCRVPYFIKQS